VKAHSHLQCNRARVLPWGKAEHKNEELSVPTEKLILFGSYWRTTFLRAAENIYNLSIYRRPTLVSKTQIGEK
jgi:hypothetical protein